MVSRPTGHSALHDGYLARRPLVAIITCFNFERNPSSKSGCQNLADDARPNLAHIVSSLVNLHTGSCSDHFADHWPIFTSVILRQSLGTLGLTWSHHQPWCVASGYVAINSVLYRYALSIGNLAGRDISAHSQPRLDCPSPKTSAQSSFPNWRRWLNCVSHRWQQSFLLRLSDWCTGKSAVNYLTPRG